MGKVGKRQPQKHSNHHDNPHRTGKSVTRRQHSQNAPKKTGPKLNHKPGHAGSKAETKPHVTQTKFKVPFSKWDRVLLVGEGDFSFALSLVSNHQVSEVIATCFDTKDVLEQKYPSVVRTVRKLETREQKFNDREDSGNVNKSGEDAEVWEGFSPSASSNDDLVDARNDEKSRKNVKCTVLHGIDATKLSTAHKNTLRSYGPFTKIVFNFPHVGGLSTDVNRQVRSNQQLLVGFFNAAKSFLATTSSPAKLPVNDDEYYEDYMDYDSDIATDRKKHLEHGQLLVSIFEGEPYTLWNIRDLARHSGLKVLESFKFPWAAYPGYQHARTIGDIVSGKDRSDESKRKGAWRGEERDARCYVLSLKDDNGGQPTPGSKKRKKQDDSD